MGLPILIWNILGVAVLVVVSGVLMVLSGMVLGLLAGAELTTGRNKLRIGFRGDSLLPASVRWHGAAVLAVAAYPLIVGVWFLVGEPLWLPRPIPVVAILALICFGALFFCQALSARVAIAAKTSGREEL